MKNDNRRDGGNGGYKPRGDGYRGGDSRGSDRNPRTNRFDGPGRRTYGEGRSNPPRVGRVAQDVPRARQVTGDYAREDAPKGRRGSSDYARSEMPKARQVTGGYARPDMPRDRRGSNDYARSEGAPKARRVTGDYRAPSREDIVERDFSRKPPHHGSAYRSESGPRTWRRQEQGYDYEAPEIPEGLAEEFTDVPADEHLLAGRNPIKEALRAGRPIEKLLVADGDLSGAGREIVRLARDAGAVVQTVDRSRLDQIYPAHQGMLAYVAAVPYAAVEDMLATAKEKGEDPFVVVLDGITDPHNLGAIIRSAECAGAHGVVIPERRAAGLSPAAAKAAAGAMNYMPIARVKNLNRTLEDLKAQGLWVTGAAMEGESASTCDLTGPIALVIGSEGDGISRLTLEKCDRVVSLPVRGHIDSLNASVAAGVLMYEIVRQRGL